MLTLLHGQKYLLIIPVIVGILISAILTLPALISTPSLMIVMGSGMLLFARSCYLSGQVGEGLWAGYSYMAIGMTWIIVNPGAAFIVTCVGAGIGIYFIVRQHRSSYIAYPAADEWLSLVFIKGAGILAGSLFYHAADGTVPVMMLNEQTLPLLISALFIAFATLQVAGILLTGRTVETQLKLINEQIYSECLVFALILISAPIFYQVGVIAFLIIVLLAALQNTRHYQAFTTNALLTQRVRELSTLNTLAQTVSENLTLDDVLYSIYREISTLIDATDFIVALYDDTNQIISYPMAIQNGERQIIPPRTRGHGLTDTVIRSRQSLHISRDEASTHPGINIEEVRSAAYLGVPLMRGEQPVGVIALAHQHNPAAFTEDDLSILQLIAGQVSLTVRNASLYDRSNQMVTRLNRVNGSIQTVMFNIDSKAATRHVCTIAQEVLGAQKAAIFIQDRVERDKLMMTHAVGFTEAVWETYAKIPYDTTKYENGSFAITDSHHINDPALKEWADVAGFSAMLEVPLRAGSVISGCLAVYHDTPCYYQPEDINILMMLSNQITAALDNAELLQMLELYASEQSQLVHLSRISGATLDLNRIVLDVSDILCEMLQVDGTDIILLPASRDRFQLYTPHLNTVRQEEMPFHHIPELQHLLTSGNIYLREYHHHDSLSAGLLNFMKNRDYSSIAVIPMWLNQEIIGFLLPGTEALHTFDDHQYRLIEMSSNQIAAQMQNARIHSVTEEALVTRLEQLSMIEEIASQISQSLDSDTIIRSVLKAALDSTRSDRARIMLLEPDNEHHLIEYRQYEGERQYIESFHGGYHPLLDKIMQSGNVIIEPDITEVDEYSKVTTPATYTSVSLMAVPLKSGEEIIGVLSAESQVKNFYNTRQAGFLQNLAGHAAISLENARLLVERQNQIQTLTYLRELTLEASTSVETDRVINAILMTALEILGAKEGSLFSYNDGDIVQSGWMNRNHNVPQPENLSLPRYLLERVIRTRKQIFIPDITQSIYNDDASLLRYHSVLVIPIFRHDEVTEVLGLAFDKVPILQDSYNNTIELLAVQVAGHLENIILNDVLRANARQMRAILDTTHDGILLLDRYGKIQDVNPAISRFLDINMKEYINWRLEHVIIKNFDNANVTKNADVLLHIGKEYWQDSEETSRREYTLEHAEPVHIREFSVPVQDSNGEVLGRLFSLRDITEEKEIAEYRQKIQSMVLHDLQSPLSSMITSLDLSIDMMKTVEPDNVERVTAIQKISIESARNLLSLVETMRDIPRLNKGELPLEHMYLPVEDIIDDAYYTLITSLKQSEIEFEIRFEDSVGSVYVDRRLIRRVFINLIHNAYKFTPKGGKILIKSDDNAGQPGFIRVLVCDSGKGIPADMRDRIFNEFEQIKGHKPHQGGKGTGLGLNFCKLAVEAHGGRIQVEETGLLPGACFSVTLPIPESP